MDLSELYSFYYSICFHLTVDYVCPSAITKMENLAVKYLKQWLRLPRSATRVILYYPGVCSPSISLVAKHCKLSLLANITQSSDPMLRELALQLDFGSGLLQINDEHRGILTHARKQLSYIHQLRNFIVSARKLLLQRIRYCVLISLTP